MDTSDLAKRMKDYESISKTKLMKRCPVICRIDGKAHHSFCRGFKRPFDEIYVKSMQETAKHLCENIQGVVLSYQQSDEITLVMIDYEKLNTSPYFDYEVQKLCATMAFNKAFYKAFDEWGHENLPDWDMGGTNEPVDESIMKLCEVYGKAQDKGAMFDCRCFNIPKEEVTNAIYWRQLDAARNSIQMVGQANFSHKELQYKSCNDIQDMLILQKGINWNNFPTHLKRGSCCIKEEYKDSSVLPDMQVTRTRWVVDQEIPIFKNEGREYIEKLINVGE